MSLRSSYCLAMLLLGCGPVSEGGQGETAQAVAGPAGVVVTAPADGQLAVSWTADSAAFKYYVYQSTGGGSLVLVASVLDPSAQPPAPTTYTASGLTGGTTYCYAVQSAYPDGSTSDIGAPGCAVATGTGSIGTAAHTLIVPVLPAKLDSVEIAQWASVGGLGSASHWSYVPLSLPVGVTIIALRARVQDAGSGTTLRTRLLAMSDGNESYSVVATSPSSSGTAAEETIAIPGPITTAPATQYVVETGDSANPNNLDSKLFRIEIDE